MRIFYILLISSFTFHPSYSQDCTSCPPISIACDPDGKAAGAIDGNVKVSTGTDASGCLTAIENCVDDNGVPGFFYAPDGTYFPSGTLFNCTAKGQWLDGVTTLYCDVPNTSPYDFNHNNNYTHHNDDYYSNDDIDINYNYSNYHNNHHTHHNDDYDSNYHYYHHTHDNFDFNHNHNSNHHYNHDSHHNHNYHSNDN
ncbi:hypothetical protein FO519_009517 [Halicephalobus sp. NKZ332]|nr:hypothetical protein FO519_009517 [Halicephalobus sp. NKZ332]